VVKRFTMDFGRRLRARAAMRRQRYLTRSFARKQDEERLAGECSGSLLTSTKCPWPESGILVAPMAALCEVDQSC